MTRFRRLLLGLPLLLAPLVAVPAAVVTADPTPGPRAPGAAEVGPLAEPGELMAMRAAGGPGRTIPTGAYPTAVQHAEAIGKARHHGSDRELSEARWKLEGPTNIGGRVLDVVVDPTRKDTIYVAAASGGVWVSTDAGRRFSPAWPAGHVQAIGALAIAPDGTLYAGTGEAGPGGGSLTYGGNGVYRSRDRGRTWQHLGLVASERIGRIVVEPKNPRRVWVAAVGPMFGPGGQRGLYLSTDAGRSFRRVHEATTPTGGTVDVAVDPVNPKVVIAADWDRVRHPGDRQYTGSGSALYRSTDGGLTWSAAATPYFGPGIPTVGRLGVAFAPSDHNRVYVLASTVDGLTQGFWTSTDNGVSYAPTSFDEALVTGGFVYAWWFGRVYVDPKDADHVYATGVNLSESKDGGRTFDAPGGFHADQHGMAWDARVPGRVYLGNDGGVYRSDDGGRSWKHGEYMPWNQPFSVDVSQQRPERILTGLQDNGGNRSYRRDEAGHDQYNDITGGDGTEMRVNPKNDQVVYGCSQYGACAVSHDGGTSMTGFDTQVVGNRKNWLTPIVFHPGRPATVYTGSSILHRSTDDGATWTPISPDLTDGEAGSLELNPLFRNYNTITTIAVPPSETGTIYVGTDDGHVAYTHDDGLTWTRAEGLPTDWVTRVASVSGKVVYAAFSGFRRGDHSARLYRSANGGLTWKPIAGNLPKAPVNDVLVLGRDLVVATDVGVFTTHDAENGSRWIRLGQGLPQAPIWDLAYVAKNNSVYAANFGRGVYRLRLPDEVGRPVGQGNSLVPAWSGKDAAPVAALLLLAGLAVVALRRTPRLVDLPGHSRTV